MLKRNKIWLHGAHYGENFGDILITQIMLNKIRKSQTGQVELPLSISRFAKYVSVKPLTILSVFAPKMIIFGPGGYLGEPGRLRLKWLFRFIFYHGLLILYSKAFSVPTAIVGTGVGPCNNLIVKRLVKLLLNNAFYVSVRDMESKEFVDQLSGSSNQVSVHPDVAFGLGQLFKMGASKRVEGTVGLHFPVSNEDISKELEHDVLTFVKQNSDKRIKILFDGPKQHLKRADILNKILEYKNVEMCEFISVNELLKNIAESEVVVTTKLHVGICAYALKTRVVSLYTHPKNIRFFKQIRQERYCESLSSYQSGSLTDLIMEAMSEDNYFIMHENLLAREREGNKEFIASMSVQKLI